MESPLMLRIIRWLDVLACQGLKLLRVEQCSSLLSIVRTTLHLSRTLNHCVPPQYSGPASLDCSRISASKCHMLPQLSSYRTQTRIPKSLMLWNSTFR